MQQLTKSRANAIRNAITLLFVVQGVSVTTYFPRIPELIDQINVSFSTWGIIIGVGGMGSLLGLSLANQLIAAFGTTRVGKYSAIGMAGSIAAFAFTTDPFLFLVANLTLSFAGGLFNISINAQAIALQNRVGKVLLGRFHGSWSLGAGASAVLSGWFSTFMPLWIHLTIVPAAAIAAFFYASRNMLQRDEEDRNIAGSTRKALNIFKAPKATWFLTLAGFLAIFPEVSIMDWSTVFSSKTLGLDAGASALPYIAFVLAMITGRLSLERLTKIWPLYKISRTAVSVGAVAFATSIFVAPALAETDKILAMVVLVILWFVVGLGLSSTVPTVFGAAAFVKGFTAAQVIAMMSLIHTFAFMFAKMLMGGLAQAITLQWAFVFPVAMMFGAAAIVGIVGKKTPSAQTMQNAYPPTGPVSAID